MSTETASSEEKPHISINESSKPSRPARTPVQIALDSLRSAQEDIGQISELSSEEETLVTEFFESLSKVMEPVEQSLSVSPEKLSKYLSDVVQASVDRSGHLVILHKDGKIELKNLREEKHRNLLVSVLEDLLPRFKQLFSDQRQRIEDRMSFFLAVTKEMQKMSKALSKTET